MKPTAEENKSKMEVVLHNERENVKKFIKENYRNININKFIPRSWRWEDIFELIEEYHLSEVGSLKLGEHPDEMRPRSKTWLEERRAWQAEVKKLQEYSLSQHQPLSREERLDIIAQWHRSKYPYYNSSHGDWLKNNEIQSNMILEYIESLSLPVTGITDGQIFEEAQKQDYSGTYYADILFIRGAKWMRSFLTSK